MYAPNLRRAGAATRPGNPRRVRPLGTGRAPPASRQRGNGAGVTAGGTRDASTAAAVQQAAAAESNIAGWRLPSASSVAGAVALVPVVGGAWLVTVYALRQRLCEHHLQQVEGLDSAASREKERRRRSRTSGGGRGPGTGSSGGGRATVRPMHPPLYPGSSADARALREVLSRPASGVTVLCVDPPASYTGDAFVRSALLGRAATVHVQAGEGYGSLASCLARGLGVEFMAIKLQMSALLPGLAAGEQASSGARGGAGGSSSTDTTNSELSDIRAVLETATAALEEIRNQADDPRNHLPPVIVMDGLLGRIREAGEDVPAAVEAVLRWCWTITGGRRLAHVVLVAPQSLAVDGSLVRVKGFLNDGRLAPGMMRVIALNAPDSSVIERRFRSRFAAAPQQPTQGGAGEEGERAVTLCMELVHREGCSVAEEANEILTRTDFSDDSPDKLSAARLALEESLDGFALEAWRRVGAAVESTAAIAPRGFAGAAAVVGTPGAVSSAALASNQRAPVPPSTSAGGSSGATSAKRNTQEVRAESGVTRTRTSLGSGGGGDGDPAGGGEEGGVQTANHDVDGGAAVAAGAGPGDDRAESEVPGLSSPAAAVAPKDGKRGHADSSVEVEATREELQQQRQQESLQDEGKEPPAADVTADEPASLEASELSSELSPSAGGEEEAVYWEEAESLSAPVVAEDSSFSSSSAVAAVDAAEASAEEASEAAVCNPADPATPVGRLVELLGELADGGKVSVHHAVAALDGDGKALARLLDLGVLRLCPQTRSSSVGAGRIDRSTVRAGGTASILSSLSLSLPGSSLDASHSRPGRGSTSADVLAEAGAAFQVGAATPLMAGVFSILKGCQGVEEQAIARATHFLSRGGNENATAAAAAAADSATKSRSGTSFEEESEEWQAHREASMAMLVRRAMTSSAQEQESAPAVTAGRGRRASRVDRDRDRDRGGGSRRSSTSAYRTRRLQTALAAVGCMTTWMEIFKELSAADSPGDMLLADETFLHELLRTYRRTLPPPPPAVAAAAAIPRDNAAVSEPGRLRVADGSGGGNSDRRSGASVEQPGEGVAAHTTSGVPSTAANAGEEGGSTAAEVVPAGGGEGEETNAADNRWMNAASDDVMREGGERQQRGDIAETSPVNEREAVVSVESRSGRGIADEDEVGPTGHQRVANLGAEDQEDNGTKAVGGDALSAEMQQPHTEDGNGGSSVSPAGDGESAARADDLDAAHGSTATPQEEAAAEESRGAGNAQDSPLPPAAAEAGTPSLTWSDDAREEEAELPRSEGRTFNAMSPAGNDVNGNRSRGNGGDDGNGDGGPAPRPPLPDESGEPGAGPPAGQAGRPPTAPTENSGSAPAGDGGTDHGDGENAGSSNNAGGGGGDSYPGGSSEEEEDANVDVGVTARHEQEGKINGSSNNVQSLLTTTADKPLGYRAAPWAWLVPSWPGAGGKHH
ncbi:unnamed protein product [Ectocarpus sp. 6 AP-2014]